MKNQPKEQMKLRDDAEAINGNQANDELYQKHKQEWSGTSGEGKGAPCPTGIMPCRAVPRRLSSHEIFPCSLTIFCFLSSTFN